MSLLDSINKENDIKKLSPDCMEQLAGEIREFILESVSKNGGHLASNLGAVEITMALHRCMDLPQDKIIYDVGHQSYTHKILTGRKEEFYKLRRFGGMSGFPKKSESDCDAFNTGHSSTSISALVGMAMAKELNGTNEKLCAVIGDGSMTGGMVYEALQQMSQVSTSCLIVLNDNEMSISKNVGGVSKSLSKFRIGRPYNELKSGIEKTLLNIPEVGYKMAKGIKRSKDSLKNLIVPDNMFNDLGVTYIGPIDGHDVNVMTEIFNNAFDLNRPVIVHVKTKKGKGYRLAERYPEHFHGVGPFNPETGRSLKVKTAATNTDVFARSLIEIGTKNEKVVAITAAMAHGTGIRAFQKVFPDRTFDVGIAEQHALTFAAGLASSGCIPVVALYSSFLQRAYDQLLHDICLQKLHVVICIDRSGIVGEDGETHMGIYDTSYLREMPGLEIIAPKGEKELEDAMDYAVNTATGPVAIKYTKGVAYSDLNDKNVQFLSGHSEVINFEKTVGNKNLKSIALLAVGSMVETAVKVRDKISSEYDYEPELINLRFIKPLDLDRIRETMNGFDLVCILEENVRRGSVGEEIGYIKATEGLSADIMHFCIDTETVQQGAVSKLKEELGLDAESIYNKVIEAARYEEKA